MPPYPNVRYLRLSQLVPAWLCLSATMIGSAGVWGVYLLRQSRGSELAALGVAALVCWSTASVALWITVCGLPAIFSGHPDNAPKPVDKLTSAMLGTLIRTVGPLGAAVFITQISPAMAAAQLFAKMVLFYLVALTVETVLAVRLLHDPAGTCQEGSSQSSGQPAESSVGPKSLGNSA